MRKRISPPKIPPARDPVGERLTVLEMLDIRADIPMPLDGNFPFIPGAYIESGVYRAAAAVKRERKQKALIEARYDDMLD